MTNNDSSRKPAPGKKRYRRTDDELIADLKDRIAELKARAEAKKLKESPAVKRTLTALRSLDKALEEAKEEKNSELSQALYQGREPIAAYLNEQGVKLPKPRKPRARRSR